MLRPSRYIGQQPSKNHNVILCLVVVLCLFVSTGVKERVLNIKMTSGFMSKILY